MLSANILRKKSYKTAFYLTQEIFNAGLNKEYYYWWGPIRCLLGRVALLVSLFEMQ